MPRYISPYFKDIRKSQSDILAQYGDIYRLAEQSGKLNRYWHKKAIHIAVKYAENARAWALNNGHYETSAHLVPAPQDILNK